MTLLSEAIVQGSHFAYNLQIKPTDRSTRGQFWRQLDGVDLASALMWIPVLCSARPGKAHIYLRVSRQKLWYAMQQDNALGMQAMPL